MNETTHGVKQAPTPHVNFYKNSLIQANRQMELQDGLCTPSWKKSAHWIYAQAKQSSRIYKRVAATPWPFAPCSPSFIAQACYPVPPFRSQSAELVITCGMQASSRRGVQLSDRIARWSAHSSEKLAALLYPELRCAALYDTVCCTEGWDYH